MNSNEALINKFYSCFKNKDFDGIAQCYADNAVFNDPIFTNLNADQVRAMWRMIGSRSQDLSVQFKNVSADEKNGTAEWRATYVFSATGRKITNNVQATFVLEQGKIIRHTDSYSFYTWARQAFGRPGLILGWTKWFKNKTRKAAMKNLAEFMQSK